ncbi:hypothetical protein [Mongoliitalea daihaiensis]|uniref:hypothetical protein n=1 Tax=Mongoliitalea daihaiensis TaxID=2782006 RepID=UPI001F37F5BE|nr:hypothetical protein [Mongoliitalea daihaiensis]UJP63816.1 hypothetical protein IPZ59_13380 [Mongoliitalea daihaiensis]
MKNQVLILFVLLVSPFFSWAQGSVADEIILIQSAFGMEKRALVEDYMGFPKTSQFWMVYESYEGERRALIKQRILTINDYLESFETLSDADADRIAKAIIANNVSIANLQKRYHKRFNKVVSPTETAKFMQLDSFIQNTVLLAIAESLPFIGEKK